MTIRLATLSDSAALAALNNSSFEKGWDSAAMLASIESDLVLVSDCPGTGVLNGFLIVRHGADEAEVLTLCVQNAVRQTGIGTALLIAALHRLRGYSVEKLFLEVANDNFGALALYQRLGFSQIAIRKGYYAHEIGLATDAIIMCLTIGTGESAPNT